MAKTKRRSTSKSSSPRKKTNSQKIPSLYGVSRTHILIATSVVGVVALVAMNPDSFPIKSSDKTSSVLGETSTSPKTAAEIEAYKQQNRKTPEEIAEYKRLNKKTPEQIQQYKEQNKKTPEQIEAHKQQLRLQKNPELHRQQLQELKHGSDSGRLSESKQLLEAHLLENGASLSTESGLPVLEHGRVRAKFSHPLSVDPVTNQLIVTTPKGTKVVAVLPDQAVQNLSRRGIVLDTPVATSTSEIALKEEEGDLVYEVEGEVSENLLGIIPLKHKVKATVSAETGEVTTEKKSSWSKFLSILSF